MRISRRLVSTALISGLAVAWLVPKPGAKADGKITETNMTQNDYDNITRTETSVPGQDKVPLPQPVHDLSGPDRKQVNDAHGMKMIDDSVWNRSSPEERDAHLREVQNRMPAGAKLILLVPKGEVWMIPPVDGQDSYGDLKKSNAIREWTLAELTAKGIAVPADDPNFHQDPRRGTSPRDQNIKVDLKL
ncbi:MAG TPA: hypothetical protein VHA35_16835 [Dongiaceae bacterium]|jgi:hypothetical protein|nr:hypothetical protein [Dongiaceae bacterium]